MTHSLRTLIVVPVLLSLGAQTQQTRTAQIRAMQVAEDSRMRDSASMAPLRAGLRSSDTELQVLALRGLGRLEVPALVPELAALLNSPSAAVRVDAAHAVAQSAAGASFAAAARSAAALQAFDELRARSIREDDPRVRAALVRSISRLQLTQAAQVQFADSMALTLMRMPTDSAAFVTSLLIIERLARLHTRVSPLSANAIASLRAIVLGRPATATSPVPPAYARRLAFMSLTASGQMNAEILTHAMGDPDPQVRRLTAAAAAPLQNVEQRGRIMQLLLSDSAQIVRLEVVRGWLRGGMATECLPIVRAINDSALNVATGAIGILAQVGTGCPEAERGSIVASLVSAAGAVRGAGTDVSTPAGRAAMHRAAHLLVSLAALSPATARPMIGSAMAHPSWVARMYAARVAATLRDTSALLRLASDKDGNVRSTAIEGLRRTVMHAADTVFISSLAHSDYNVVRVSAAALAQSPARAAASSALFTALARISRQQRETSRDARVALVDRIGELASAADSSALMIYLRDFDPTVADRSAQILSRWTGRSITSSPTRLPPADRPPVESAVAAGTRLRFTMSRAAGGGTFEMELRPEVAPYTVARLVRLARSGYYNGLTFHRVAPNFVLQGGSPGANEYVGDGPFMRDEIWLNSHERATVGISTRGRDTGDAQIFVNTVDNPRLDFDYTVFARVVTGMAVVDATVEGDIIERVEVVAPR